MEPALRIITELPLKELWNDQGIVSRHRLRELSVADIKRLLRRGSVRFVVADIGAKPQWIPQAETLTFWKTELQPRLVESDQRVELETLPGGYAYFASEWEVCGGSVVLAQRCH